MSANRLLILDLEPQAGCEGFGGLRRWLRTCLPGVEAFVSVETALAAVGSGAAIVVHGEPGVALQRAALRLEESSNGVRPFIVHHEDARGSTCAPNLAESYDAVSALLARHAAFQILPGIVGRSASVCDAAAHVRLVAGSDAVCLIQGETGTGKELFARAIHYSSARSHRPFFPVNCGAIPDQLFENELFGHTRGAFTDAKSDHRGLLALAEGGTLFLDEVDCLSPAAQVKLLRVLQEREYRPLGSADSRKADVRVLAATNSDLRAKVRDQRFREDLFHRLDILRLAVPPLRERHGDMPLLARWFVREFARRYGRPLPAIGECATAAMTQYSWPGNVRELQAVLERAVLLSRTGTIVAGDLELPLAPAEVEATNMRTAKNRAISRFEQSYLSDVLARCGGNVSRAARIAGKERRAFQRLLRKHNLCATAFRFDD